MTASKELQNECSAPQTDAATATRTTKSPLAIVFDENIQHLGRLAPQREQGHGHG